MKVNLCALGVELTSVAHLKALIILYWKLDRPVAWQSSYYGPRPLEKVILLLKMANVRFDLLLAVGTFQYIHEYSQTFPNIVKHIKTFRNIPIYSGMFQ